MLIILRSAQPATQAAVAQQSQEHKGRLKITATPEFGTTRVDNWIADYLSKWPKVTVEAIYSIRFVDIIHEGIDVAIRIGILQDSDLSARKLGEITYGLYAAPAYLKEGAALRTVDDLKRHDLIENVQRPCELDPCQWPSNGEGFAVATLRAR